MTIRLEIDQKSLYANIKNDNLTGHTATVATPLKQGKSFNPDVVGILDIPENISEEEKDELKNCLLANSRADAQIERVCVFNRISVNGISVDTHFSYCIYIRKETNPENVHFGRQKIHYPQSLEYEAEDFHINNKEVLRAVSEKLHDYAFIVRAFEYNTETKNLNFDCRIIGTHDVPYSKVFINRRGVGKKYVSVFNEYAEIYDTEIIAMRKHLGYEAVTPDNFMEVMEKNKKTALEVAKDYLISEGYEKTDIIKEAYPYSIYDIECQREREKEYFIVRFTSTAVPYFNLSRSAVEFINDFEQQTHVLLITDINDNFKVTCFEPQELHLMKKTIQSVTYDRS